MKKKTAILSLAFASALVFGGSTLPSSQQTEVVSQLDNTLSRLESYANMSYDFENPQNMLLGDDYFLFYENGNYNLSTTRSYLFYNDSMFQAQNRQNSNNNYAQNGNLNKTYTLRNTPQSNMTTNQNKVEQNYKNDTQTNTNSLMNTTQNYSQNSTNQNKTSINPTPSNNETMSSNYSYTNNLNNNKQNSTLSSTTRQIINSENSTDLTSKNNQNSYLQEINKTASLTDNSAQNSDYSNYQTDFSGINQTLSQNIQNLRQNMQNNNQNVNMKTLRAYSYTLNNITNKIEVEQKDLMNSLNKIAIIGSNQDYNEINSAIKLNLKATLKSRLVLMECANEAIVNLNSLYAGQNNTNIQTPNQNSQSNSQSTSNSQNQNNNTNTTTQSPINNQNSGSITNQSNQNNQNFAMTNSYQNSMNGSTTSTNTTTASAKAFFDENESVATPQITNESKQNLNNEKHFQKKLGSKM